MRQASMNCGRSLYVTMLWYIDIGKLVQLVKIMLSCFANSSPIERSYSHLAMICEKHRNRMLEDTMSTLYMLKVLGVKPKSADEYHDVIAVMEGRD